MFGQNEIAGRKTFSEVPDGHLMVTSIFHTLQGEGPYAGIPAVFVRLSKCNLSCSFCDTYFDSGEVMSFQRIVDEIHRCVPKTPLPKLLVITGGEPMLQKQVSKFVMEASCLFSMIQIETNGLQPMDQLPNFVHVVMSPKCAEVEGRPDHYQRPIVINLMRADSLKFVLTAEKSPYHEVPYWALQWRDMKGGDIFVSPMTQYLRQPNKGPSLDLGDRSKAELVSFWEEGLIDKESAKLNHEHAARYALEHGLRFTMQMQLFTSLP